MTLYTARNHDDYRLLEGRPDVRSWPVHTDGDHRVGTVRDLLVDEGGRARYLDVDLADRSDRVLVPVGHARVDRKGERVRLPGVSRDRLRDVPTWSGRLDELSPRREREVAEAWDASYEETAHHRRPDFHVHDERHAEPRDERERTTRGTLARLDELDDYEVADHDVDPRGWKILGRDGETLGRIDHLIGDTGRMKVRYFVADLRESLEATPDRSDHDHHHILIPAGHVHLDRDEHHAWIDGLARADVRALPRYEGGSIDRDHERRISRAWVDALGERHRHHHPRYRESTLYGEPHRRTTGTTP